MPADILIENEDTFAIAKGGAVHATGSSENKRALLELGYHGEYFNNIREKLLNKELSKECSRCNTYNVADNKKLDEEIQKSIYKKNSQNILKKIKQRLIRWKKRR